MEWSVDACLFKVYLCFQNTPLRLFLFIISLILTGNLTSQDRRSIHIEKTEVSIELDGELNEACWEKAEKAEGFYQNYPSDTSMAEVKTVAMVTYDDEYLYVGAICYDDHPDQKYVVQSLRRDFSYPISDAFAIFIDPFNDRTNGFSFAVNPLGAQREGSLQSGGGFGVSTAWDNKWFSEVKHHDYGWVVEMKIPFKTLRYNSDLESWGINFSRNDLKVNENSSWSRVPRAYNIATLAFTGDMIWDKSPPKAGANVSLIPYAFGGVYADYENGTSNIKTNIGGDAKIAVTSSLNLDLTINPDFSQVDVDAQVTNLSRFSLFFPERRQFFIENDDLFGQFGFSKIRPFFSRRIGLESGQQVPIIAGARLSGKLNEDWRVGVMNMQTEGMGSLGLDPQNYSVGVFQRKVGVRSYFGGIMVNRQGFDDRTVDYSDYNRVFGIDFNLASEDNMKRGKAFYHRSFSPGKEDQAHAVWFMYNSEAISAHWNHEYVGKDYRADVGFVPRITQYNSELGEYVYSSYWRLEPSFSYRFYPKNEKIVNYQPTVYLSEYMNSDFKTNERLLSGAFRINFTDKSQAEAKFIHNEVLLPFNTDITFSGNSLLDSGYYHFNNLKLSYTSTKIKLLSYSASFDYGQYYVGEKLTLGGDIAYRIQPWGSISVGLQQNDIRMPEGFNDVSLTLVRSRIDLSFTKKLFFTTFVQYNTQISNININARFQYRFKPMSDLFIVYTDNYNSNIFGIKNRALVVKFVYWLNL